MKLPVKVDEWCVEKDGATYRGGSIVDANGYIVPYRDIVAALNREAAAEKLAEAVESFLADGDALALSRAFAAYRSVK